MAFFRNFIRKLLAYLAGLATARDSSDMECSDAHGVCDVAHTPGLFRAFEPQNAVNPPVPELELQEKFYPLHGLHDTIAFHRSATASA